MRFRKAVPSDLEEIVAVFGRAVKTMEENHIFQWDEQYPDRGILQEDILAKQMYVGEQEKRICSVFVLNRECDPEYETGRWKRDTKDYLVLHRLCVDPLCQNQGLGKVTVEYAEKEAEKMGCREIRLDVFSCNPFALRLYQKSGYIKTGEVYFRKGLFYLMEKELLAD